MIPVRGMVLADDFTVTLPKIRRFAWILSIGAILVTITLQLAATWWIAWSFGTRSFINIATSLFQWTDFIGLPLILAYGIRSWWRRRTERSVPWIFDQLRSPTDELLPPIKVTLPLTSALNLRAEHAYDGIPLGVRCPL